MVCTRSAVTYPKPPQNGEGFPKEQSNEYKMSAMTTTTDNEAHGFGFFASNDLGLCPNRSHSNPKQSKKVKEAWDPAMAGVQGLIHRQNRRGCPDKWHNPNGRMIPSFQDPVFHPTTVPRHPCASSLAGSGGVHVYFPVTGEDDRNVVRAFDKNFSPCCLSPLRSNELAVNLVSLSVTRRFRPFPFKGPFVFPLLLVRSSNFDPM